MKRTIIETALDVIAALIAVVVAIVNHYAANRALGFDKCVLVGGGCAELH